MRRRRFLETAGLAVLGGLAGAKAWARPEDSEPSPSLIVRTLLPENFETPIGWFDRLLTPTDVFFVRSHFGAPRVAASRTLRIEGLVERPVALGQAELEAMPQITVTAVLQCAGNGRSLQEPRVPGVQWAHGAMGQATWTGVRLSDLLKHAGVGADAAHVGFEGGDVRPLATVPPFHRSVPLARAMDETTLVALRMNGEPLTHAHGAPYRLVVPGWAGDHWMKWLAVVRPQREESPGFYMQTAYRVPKTPVAPATAVPPADMIPATTFPLRSVIARPTEGSRVPRGPQEVVGVAFSGEAAVDRVEVSLDGGDTWRKADLEGDAGVGRWQVFRSRFDAPPGPARALVRAVDASGAVQPEHATWNPSGYFWNGWHAVAWEVV
jgi:DMSO/TMAO reductase YedYZ molybdopterin-dependent catalytic subunit